MLVQVFVSEEYLSIFLNDAELIVLNFHVFLKSPAKKVVFLNFQGAVISYWVTLAM